MALSNFTARVWSHPHCSVSQLIARDQWICRSLRLGVGEAVAVEGRDPRTIGIEGRRDISTAGVPITVCE